MHKIEVSLNQSYDILIGTELLDRTGELILRYRSEGRIAIITDENVDVLYSPILEKSLCELGFTVCKYVIKAGEKSKSLEVAGKIYDFLSQNDITRSDLLIALGGGVVGDLTGFVAATYLRGVSFIQIPTTFLSAIDSSVGGKTGVNTSQGKNLVGAFWQPSLVICDLSTLKTLSEDIFSDGIGEALKYGAILDESLFIQISSGGLYEKMKSDDFFELTQIVRKCIELKKNIVMQDERETGIRKILNFGHTFGHAVEKISQYSISHGKAIGIGMVIVTEISEKRSMTPPGTAQKIINALKANNMPYECQADEQQLWKVIRHDKKRVGNKIAFVVLEKMGKATIKDWSIV